MSECRSVGGGWAEGMEVEWQSVVVSKCRRRKGRGSGDGVSECWSVGVTECRRQKGGGGGGGVSERQSFGVALTVWHPTSSISPRFCSGAAIGGSPGWGGQRPPSLPLRRDLTSSAVAVSSVRISVAISLIILRINDPFAFPCGAARWACPASGEASEANDFPDIDGNAPFSWIPDAGLESPNRGLVPPGSSSCNSLLFSSTAGPIPGPPT